MRNVGNAAKLGLQHLLTSLRRSGEPVELHAAMDVEHHQREVSPDSANQPVDADHEDALPREPLVHPQHRVGEEKPDANEEARRREIAERGARIEDAVHDESDAAKRRGERDRHRHHEIQRKLEQRQNSDARDGENDGGDEHFAGFFQREVAERGADKGTEYATRNDGRIEAVADHVPAHQPVVDEGEENTGEGRSDGADRKVELLVHCMSFLIALAIFCLSI